MATKKLPRAYSKETMELAEQRAPKATNRSVMNKRITEEDLSGISSFADYSKMRQRKEKEEAIKSAAEKLTVLTAPKTQGLPRAYGRSIMNIVKDRAPSTITPAQMPVDFEITPQKYLESIKDINYKHDAETQAFFDKYFDGKIPTEEEYRTTYRNLIDKGALTEAEMMSFHANQGMFRKATEAEEKKKEADELLGKDAKTFAGLSESEIYERFAETDNSADEVAQKYANYAEEERNVLGYLKYLMQVGPKAETITSGVLNPDLFGKVNNTEMPDSTVMAYAKMTPKQRKTYLYTAGKYGEKAATDYFESLLKDEGYNKRAYDIRDTELRNEADEDAARATLYSMLEAPGQVAGTAYAISKWLQGEEIDPYHSAFTPGQMVQTPRGQVLENITQKYGNTDEKTGDVRDTFKSTLLRAAYSAGTSFTDSMTANLLSGGIPGGSALIQGGMQLGNAAQDVKLRGGSDKQALGLGIVDALIEAGTEYIPADNLIKAIQGNDIKTIKDFGWNIVKSIFGEGPGEGLSELGSAAADRIIMGELSEWEQTAKTEGTWAAAKNLLKNVGEAMLAGVISGGAEGVIGGSAGYAKNRRTEKQIQKELAEAAKQAEEIAKAEQQAEAPAEQPAQQTETPDVREELMREYEPEPAQEAEQPTSEPETEEESTTEEESAKTPEMPENGQALKVARMAMTHDDDGAEKQVRVVGVMMDDDVPVMLTEDENGKQDVELASDLSFGDETDELLAYDGVKRMDARALRNYLEGYSAQRGTAEEYASAYNSVYMRARGGVDYEQAALSNADARAHLTEDAMLDAYSAGMNAYNQEHETVQPAQVESMQAQEAPEGAVFSAKESAKGGKISKQYTADGFRKLGKDGQKKMLAQMELLKAIASRTGRTISIVDSIKGRDGERANAMYIPATGEIRVALDAQEGAYAYAAMHELTHAMKNEHRAEWSGFTDFVKTTLAESGGKSWDELVEYQMDKFGYNRAQAEEEVVCNTVPAILQDETNVLKLYKGNRKLFNRVLDWVKGLLNDIKTAGRELSKRSQSWAQMDALAADRKAMQEIYDRMMAVMEKPAETKTAKNKASSTDDVLQQYKNVDLSEDGHVYDYEFLVKLPDIRVSTEVPMGNVLNEKGFVNHDNLKKESLANAAKLGRMENGNVLIQNRYTGRTIRISGHSVDHSTHTDSLSKNRVNARAGMIAGELAMNAVPLNAEYDEAPDVQGTYVMAAPMRSVNGKIESVVALTMEMRTGELKSVEHFDALHAVSARKKNAGALDVQSTSAALTNQNGSTAATRSEYSIAEFLEIVKGTHQSLLSRDVLDHFGLERNQDGFYNGKVKFSYMGENARTADIHRLEEARQRLADGESAETIRKETGWFRGMDGKWRFETDDSKSRVNISQDNYRRLGELLEHSELMKAYPDMENMEVIFQKLEPGMSAQYNRQFDSIDVNYELKNKPEELKKTLLHEIQHAIQSREDFTRGASLKYWDKRIWAGFDARRAKDREILRSTEAKLQKIKEEKPAFYQDMMELEEMTPDVPRAAINWDTLETLEDDPIEWQRYDARRDQLEEKYGSQDVFDFIALAGVKERGLKSRTRTAEELYMNTAGEIEARDVAERANLTETERRTTAPALGDEDTVFSDEPVFYSMRDTDENVQDAMSAEQKAYAQVKGHRITAAEADKLAGTVLKEANSDYDRQKLAAEMSRVFDYIERGEDVDWNQVDEELTTIMARVMEKSRTLDLEHEEMAKPVRKYLRNTLIKLTQTQLEEARSAAGSYHEYRKSMFGRTTLSTVNGTPLDVAWQELHDMAPQLFDENASEGDMPMLLQQAVDALKPVYHTGKGMGVEESASWLAGKLHEAYLSLPAVKAAAKSAKTFGDSIVELKNAMKRFEETSWSEYQNALRGIREARGAQQRTKQQEEAAALRAKYVKWRERDTQARKEREMKAKYRVKIERTAGTLANWIAKPTDAKHVPAGVEDSVRRMLEVLDFSGKSTKTAKELCEKLEGLASAMENAQEKEDGNQEIFLERDQQMIDQIRWVAEMIRGNTEHHTSEGRGVYELNGLELKELSKWLDVVKHVITQASKLRGSNLPGESVEQVAAMSMAEISRKKPWKDKKWATKQWQERFGPDMQDSFTFFERLGPTTNAIFRGLREGFDKVTQLTRQAEEHTKRILEGVKLNELTGKKAKKQTFQVKGGTVELTKANIMELYVLSRREQAQGHIYGEGIRIQGDEDVRAKALTKADVAKIIGTLTADERRVAEGMQAFLSRECASWGNETSMKLLGYRKFGEEHYWPIRTDSNTRNTTRLEDNYAANISAIKNQGMTKATIEGAKNAIVIGDIFDTYTRHISNMAAYAGYALPLSDFTRWYNTRGVKTEIEQVMGKKGLTYINNFLMAVNGSALQADQSGLERLAGSFTRNAKIASVGANARVVIQQPTSYARAAMYMSPKYLSKALVMKKPKAELVNRYCGIAQWKRWGFYETNIGPNLRQMIVGDETLANRAREIAMKPAAVGDEWTLNHLWNACELETRDLMPEMKQGTEEYYQAVGKRMSEIIDRTQVVDSVFHRSQMMRSRNGMAQMLTNFMSEPTKTYNMLMSAISDYADNRKNKQARNRVARAMTVYAVSGLLTAAAAAVIDAFRDEDAEKEWLEKYTGAVGDNAWDNLNPLGLLPGVKDVLSMLEGYEPSRLDTQSIQKIIWAAQEINKYREGTSKQNLYGVTYKTAQALSSVLGVPVSNVMRDINAVIQTVTGTSITKTPEARKSNTVTYLYKALEDGKTAYAKKLRTELKEQAGLSEKEIDTALAEKMKEDPKTKEAYDAKMAKDFAKMNKAINALTAMGFSRDTVDKAILSHKPKEEKEKDPEEQLKVALYSEKEVVDAMKTLAGIERGGRVTESDVRAMISDRAAASTAKEPEKSVISGVQSELKKDYLTMEQKGDAAGMKKLGMVMHNVLDTPQEKMDEWVRDQHADNLREAVDGNNKTAALKAVTVMRRDGKTDSQIKSSLSKYKQLYIDAMKKGNKASANRIKNMLMSLGLKGKNGKSLYTEKTFEDWLKEN